MFLICSSLFRPPPPDSCATLTTPATDHDDPGIIGGAGMSSVKPNATTQRNTKQ